MVRTKLVYLVKSHAYATSGNSGGDQMPMPELRRDYDPGVTPEGTTSIKRGQANR